MVRLRRSIAIIGLASSMLVAIPLRVEAAPELTISTRDVPKGQRSAHEAGMKAALAGDAEGAIGGTTKFE